MVKKKLSLQTEILQLRKQKLQLEVEILKQQLNKILQPWKSFEERYLNKNPNSKNYNGKMRR